MKIHRIDHVGIVVKDLSAAKAFFLDLGLEVKGETEVKGEWVERVIGLNDVRVMVVMLGTQDGQVNLELAMFYTPSDERSIQESFANTPGIRHIAFVVEDIEAVIAQLKKKGRETFGEIQTATALENTRYKLCYIRGPEGIILELAEQIK
jgi:catechol 2,3-dioxygenase-like lactoylglutathione lyase family enzyme